MKKIGILFLILLCGCEANNHINLVEPEKIEVKKSEFEFSEKINLYEILNISNADIITKDQELDTLSLGKHNLDILYKHENKEKKYILEYNVVDTTPPVIRASNLSTVKGKSLNFFSNFTCGDYYDENVNCFIEGEYDFDTVGVYDLKAVAIDSSNNKKEKEFKLTVLDKKNSGSSSSRYEIKDLINKYKNENTMIGIDVSSWQTDINWAKAKEAGVEFAMIRIGFGHNKDNEIKFDSKFRDNLENAKKAGVKVGLYFYSYAKTREQAKEQAKWIVESLNGTKLDLPIAFDWEIWGGYNNYKLNFYELNMIAKEFLDEITKSGYQGMLYSSAYFANYIWSLDYPTWLAYYTSNNDYEKDYDIWQLSSNGKVDGINGAVDLDVLYKK